MQWQPIETAPKDKEIIGSKWAESVMIKEPFISFWSPTLGKFFASPTHWIEMPDRPT